MKKTWNQLKRFFPKEIRIENEINYIKKSEENVRRENLIYREKNTYMTFSNMKQ